MERQHETQFRLKISPTILCPARGAKIGSVLALRVQQSTANSRGNYAFPKTNRGPGSFCEPWIGFLLGSIRYRNQEPLRDSKVSDLRKYVDSFREKRSAFQKRRAGAGTVCPDLPCSDLEEIPRHHKKNASEPSSSNCASGPRR